jgi:hypothetical protein
LAEDSSAAEPAPRPAKPKGKSKAPAQPAAAEEPPLKEPPAKKKKVRAPKTHVPLTPEVVDVDMDVDEVQVIPPPAPAAKPAKKNLGGNSTPRAAAGKPRKAAAQVPQPDVAAGFAVPLRSKPAPRAAAPAPAFTELERAAARLDDATRPAQDDMAVIPELLHAMAATVDMVLRVSTTSALWHALGRPPIQQEVHLAVAIAANSQSLAQAAPFLPNVVSQNAERLAAEYREVYRRAVAEAERTEVREFEDNGAPLALVEDVLTRHVTGEARPRANKRRRDEPAYDIDAEEDVAGASGSRR